nr:hypothetical protein Iba_scaffold15618CG0010 [Ipomoea batatas]
MMVWIHLFAHPSNDHQPQNGNAKQPYIHPQTLSLHISHENQNHEQRTATPLSLKLRVWFQIVLGILK